MNFLPNAKVSRKHWEPLSHHTVYSLSNLIFRRPAEA